MASERVIAYMCPVGCGCIWRDNLDGTMSLFGCNSRSCATCETLPLDKLIPLKRVTATTAQPEVSGLSAEQFYTQVSNSEPWNDYLSYALNDYGREQVFKFAEAYAALKVQERDALNRTNDMLGQRVKP